MKGDGGEEERRGEEMRPDEPRDLRPELDPARGEDPRETVGDLPPTPPPSEADPGYVPDPDQADRWREAGAEIGRERRPRREDVLPYLLIRAFSPGDRGQRPLWPPTVCWESPDLLLIDASWTGPFDPARLVVSPVAGRSYRVFVRVWNLGLLPAIGVHVQAWAVAAGFFGAGNQNDPYYQQNHIGGAWVEQLDDRRSPGCTTLVELDALWEITPHETGHECLIASVSCPADDFTGPLLVNDHRHVGQRNLWVLEPGADLAPLLHLLGGLVPAGATLELTHGGPAVLPLLHAVAGGTLPWHEGDERRRLVSPELGDIRVGVDIGASVHLLTAFEQDGRSVVARSEALQKLGSRSRHYRAGRQDGRDRQDRRSGHPFTGAGATRRLLEQLGPDRWDRVGTVSDQPLAVALGEGVRNLLDVDELRSDRLAAALGGSEGAVHLLRLTATEPDGRLIGGYSVAFAGRPR